MSEFLVPDHVPRYLLEPKITVSDHGYIGIDYADGVSVFEDGEEVETRFPDGALHYEEGEDGSPVYIEEGHEDTGPINN